MLHFIQYWTKKIHFNVIYDRNVKWNVGIFLKLSGKTLQIVAILFFLNCSNTVPSCQLALQTIHKQKTSICFTLCLKNTRSLFYV